MDVVDFTVHAIGKSILALLRFKSNLCCSVFERKQQDHVNKLGDGVAVMPEKFGGGQFVSWNVS